MVARMCTPCYRKRIIALRVRDCWSCLGSCHARIFFQSANPIKLAVSWLIVTSRTRFYKINGERIYTIALARRMMIIMSFCSFRCVCVSNASIKTKPNCFIDCTWLRFSEATDTVLHADSSVANIICLRKVRAAIELRSSHESLFAS